MSEISLVRDINVIAAEINHIKNETRVMVLNNSIEIGRRLVEAKSIIGHGQWGNWLEESVNYSQRTAQNLMKIFNEYGSKQISLFGDSNSQAFADLNYSQAVALLAIPDLEEREQFVEEHDLDNMSTRELQEAIKAREAAEREREDAIRLAEELKRKATQIEQDRAKLEADIRNKDESLKLNKESIEKLQDTLEREREGAKLKVKELMERVRNIKEELVEAQQSEDEEEVSKLKSELNKKQTEEMEYMRQIQELEEKLKEKPVDVEVVEKVPEAIQKELEKLREKASLGEVTSKFKVNFDMVQENFNKLFVSLEEIPEDLKEKYKGAARTLISKMLERL